MKKGKALMRRIGMLTSGGDCQSLNATMRGVAKSLYKMFDNKDVARPKLALWFNQVEQWNCEEFNTVIKTFQKPL